MTDSQITCPKCGHNFSLTDAHKHEIEEMKVEMSKSLKVEMQKDFDERAKAYALKVKAEAEKEAKKKKVELENLRKRDEEARKKELEFLREKQAFESKQKDMEVDKERALIAERKRLEEEFAKQSTEKFNLEFEKKQLEFEKRMQEKEKQMETLKKSLDEATRKANQGSMQIQGEIQEDALKEILRTNFPIDELSDVEKGIKGADIIQSVRNKFGNPVGVIAWESKNTKAWSDSWIDKLKEDRLRVNASVSIIVTNTLPDGIKHFGLHRDIWVTEWAYVIPLTMTLREQLIVIDTMKNSLVGKDERMEILYNYLTSEQFKAKIENIVEAFTTMKDDLDREKRAMEKMWSAREKQLERVIGNTSRLYGDMQ